MSNVETVPGRSCGSCSLCCKLLRIDEFSKPEGKWCAHCAPGRGGCTIYGNRPIECRNFYCAWLTATDVGPEWKPLTCKMVLYAEGDGNRIAIHVDPSNPTAWRQEPFYSQLRERAVHAAEASQQVVVYIKNRVIVLLPDKEVDLGIMERGDQIMVGASQGRLGLEWRAFLVPAKDVPPEKIGKCTSWKKS
jgi:hypothetical protein